MTPVSGTVDWPQGPGLELYFKEWHSEPLQSIFPTFCCWVACVWMSSSPLWCPSFHHTYLPSSSSGSMVNHNPLLSSSLGTLVSVSFSQLLKHALNVTCKFSLWKIFSFFRLEYLNSTFLSPWPYLSFLKNTDGSSVASTPRVLPFTTPSGLHDVP